MSTCVCPRVVLNKCPDVWGHQPWFQCHWAVDIRPESPSPSPEATVDLWHPASWVWPNSRPLFSPPARPACRWSGAEESVWRSHGWRRRWAVLYVSMLLHCSHSFYLHSDMKVVRMSVQHLWILLSLHWCGEKKEKRFNRFYSHKAWNINRWDGTLCASILYIDFPLGLDILFLCRGATLRSSCWKARLCGGRSSGEKPLR